MIVYVVSRVEDGRVIIWPPFANLDKAKRMVETHLNWRISQGASLHRLINFTPAPVKEGTQIRVGGSASAPIWGDAVPIVECCIQEVELIVENGKGRVIYSVCQHMVIQ